MGLARKLTVSVSRIITDFNRYLLKFVKDRDLIFLKPGINEDNFTITIDCSFAFNWRRSLNLFGNNYYCFQFISIFFE